MSKSFVKTVKRRFKGWLNERRRRFIHLFRRFSKDEFASVLSRLGIKAGDVLLVHIAYDRFEGFEGTPTDVIKILQNAVSNSGTLLMPTIPFRGSALDYARSKQVTDLVWTPSATGLVTEVFRRMPDVKRSIHPTHPVAAWGIKTAELTRDHHLAETPCGKNSPFLKLLDVGGKMLFLGTGIGPMTFFHGVEEILEPQMPVSPFTAERFELETRDAEGNVWSTNTRLFDPRMSRRRDMHVLEPALRRNGYWKEGRVGGLNVILLESRQVLETCQQMAEHGRFCYRNED